MWSKDAVITGAARHHKGPRVRDRDTVKVMADKNRNYHHIVHVVSSICLVACCLFMTPQQFTGTS